MNLQIPEVIPGDWTRLSHIVRQIRRSLGTQAALSFGTLTIDSQTIADDARGLSVITKLVTNAKSDGIAGYFEGHIDGITDGPTYGTGAWLNVDSGSTTYDIRALDIGIYESGADCSGGNAYGLAVHMEFDSTNPPAAIYPFRLNTNVAGATPDALIFAANKAAVPVTVSGFPGLANAYTKIVIQDGTVYRIPLVDENNIGGDFGATDLITTGTLDCGAITSTGLILSNLTPTRLVATDASKVLVSSDLASWVTGTANRVTVSDDGDGTITLTGPQDIDATANPTFAGLTLTGDLSCDDITCGDISCEDFTVDNIGIHDNTVESDTGNLTLLATAIAVLKGDSLTQIQDTVISEVLFGNDTDTTDDDKKGIRIFQREIGDIFLDFKTYSTKAITFRCGEGAEIGATHTWMTVDPTEGYVDFPTTVTIATADINGGTMDGVTIATDCTQTEWDDAYGKRVDTWGDGLEYSAQTAYVDYNTTNLKITSTQINTIQDIDTTADPQFNSLGIGTAAAPANVGINISRTFSSSLAYVLNMAGTYNGNSDASYVIGMNFGVTYAPASPDATRTVTYLYGNIGEAKLSNTSAQDFIATNASGLITQLSVSETGTGTSTIVTGIGVDIRSPSIIGVDASITNLYGLKIGDMSAGDTLNYAIHTGAGDVLFGDKVIFTQADGNEYIDSLNDGYMDYRATTAHRFGDGTNYSKFEADGTLKFEGTATVWDDIVLPLDFAKVPAANAPDWESFVGNLNKFAYKVNDFQEFTAELLHGYKEGSAFTFHIHGALNALTAQEEKVQFEIEYSIADMDAVDGIGDVFPDGSGSLLTNELVIPDATPDLSNIYITIGVDSQGTFGIGATIVGRIRRIAKSAGGNELTGNIFVTQVGIHYEQDTVGSRTELTK